MLALLVGVGAFGLLPERAQAEPAQDGVPRLHYVIFVDDDN